MSPSTSQLAEHESKELGLWEKRRLRPSPQLGILGGAAWGLPGPLAAGPAFVVGGVYANAQMFMRDCQAVIYESPSPSPIKAVPSMF